MNKRIMKRHARQVMRAKDRVKLSEPDVRTPEEIKAAREASRPVGGRQSSGEAHYSSPSVRSHMSGSPAKADV